MLNDQLSADIFACRRCYEEGLIADMPDNRRRNRQLAYAFKPPSIELLFLAESPPVSGAYFYLLPEYRRRGVPSALFWETMRALGIIPVDAPRSYPDKERHLTAFAARGLFIVDAAKCPVNQISDGRAARVIGNCSHLLEREVRLLNPQRIVLIKRTNRVLVPRLRECGLSDRLLSDDPLSFPVAGNQGRFRREVEQLRQRYPQLRPQLGG